MHTGDIMRCTIFKVLLEVTHSEAARVAGVDQLCCRLEAGIEARIHSMKSLYDENLLNDNWGILLLDTYYAFNRGNKKILV